MNKKIVMIGAGVANINAALTLVDGGYPGELITIIDKGKDPYNRKPSEVMEGFGGAGLFSDGKYTYKHNEVGGQLVKYCSEEMADELINQGLENLKRFHPEPDKIMFSNPIEEPEFIKPYFNLRMSPTWHIGTDYLLPLGQAWYNYLVEEGVNFEWETEVTDVIFELQEIYLKNQEDYWIGGVRDEFVDHLVQLSNLTPYDILIVGAGKSGIDFTNKLIKEHKLKTEPKPIQFGVRFEAPQEHFQKLIDISYDFKLYKKINDRISLRTFCSNSGAAFVAVEETYGNHSYNGHSKKDPKLKNGMVNFGIMMEIKGIEEPFKWSRKAVELLQKDGTGLFYSPNSNRVPSKTSEGEYVKCTQVPSLNPLYEAIGDYAIDIEDFIVDMQKILPTLKEDWAVYFPEIKYLSEEVLVNYEDLSLIDYPNVHFVGDSLSARGIAVSCAQGILASLAILKKCGIYNIK